MSTNEHMTGRPSSDPALRGQDVRPVKGESSLKILLAIGAVVAILVIALWFGGNGGTSMVSTPAAPAVTAPASPAPNGAGAAPVTTQ